MNQKNVFTGISVVLILQGLVFFFMKTQIMTDAFPGLPTEAYHASGIMIEVVAALSIFIGLVAYGTRATPSVLPVFTLGSLVFLAVTLKHLLADNVNVPIPAVVIQVLIVLLCGYLWLGKKG